MENCSGSKLQDLVAFRLSHKIRVQLMTLVPSLVFLRHLVVQMSDLTKQYKIELLLYYWQIWNNCDKMWKDIRQLSDMNVVEGNFPQNIV